MASAAYSLDTRDVHCPERPATTSVSSEPDSPVWFEPTVAAAMFVRRLPENWDHRGARRVSVEVIRRAVSLLATTATYYTPAPDLVPTVNGGLQLEWHRSRMDIELEIRPDLSAELYWRDRLSELEGEEPVWHARPVRLEAVLRTLTDRHVAPAATR